MLAHPGTCPLCLSPLDVAPRTNFAVRDIIAEQWPTVLPEAVVPVYKEDGSPLPGIRLHVADNPPLCHLEHRLWEALTDSGNDRDVDIDGVRLVDSSTVRLQISRARWTVKFVPDNQCRINDIPWELPKGSKAAWQSQATLLKETMAELVTRGEDDQGDRSRTSRFLDAVEAMVKDMHLALLQSRSSRKIPPHVLLLTELREIIAKHQDSTDNKDALVEEVYDFMERKGFPDIRAPSRQPEILGRAQPSGAEQK